jgi:hypothetical protein
MLIHQYFMAEANMGSRKGERWADPGARSPADNEKVLLAANEFE